MKPQFFIEMTDTYGGESNYSWVNRFLVTASSERGAIGMVTRRTGYRARSVGCDRYDVPGACICYFVEWVDAETAKSMAENYSRIEVLP
jgi:hypothetical protein